MHVIKRNPQNYCTIVVGAMSFLLAMYSKKIEIRMRDQIIIPSAFFLGGCFLSDFGLIFHNICLCLALERVL
jgi:hypothetical protein